MSIRRVRDSCPTEVPPRPPTRGLTAWAGWAIAAPVKGAGKTLDRTATAGLRQARRIDRLLRRDPTLAPDMVRHILNSLDESPDASLERALRRGRAFHPVG